MFKSEFTYKNLNSENLEVILELKGEDVEFFSKHIIEQYEKDLRNLGFSTHVMSMNGFSYDSFDEKYCFIISNAANIEMLLENTMEKSIDSTMKKIGKSIQEGSNEYLSSFDVEIVLENVELAKVLLGGNEDSVEPTPSVKKESKIKKFTRRVVATALAIPLMFGFGISNTQATQLPAQIEVSENHPVIPKCGLEGLTGIVENISLTPSGTTVYDFPDGAYVLLNHEKNIYEFAPAFMGDWTYELENERSLAMCVLTYLESTGVLEVTGSKWFDDGSIELTIERENKISHLSFKGAGDGWYCE